MSHPAINVVHTAAGLQSAVCQFCGRTSRPVRATRPGDRLSLFDVPAGWSCAPYPEDFVHEDGSTGTQWCCRKCGRRLASGESLYSRREER